MSGRELSDRVSGWVDAGLISSQQAGAILAHEQAAAKGQLPRWVEPLAYLGVVLVAVALVLFGIQVWDRLAEWGQVALAAIVTGVLLAVGAAMNRYAAPGARRAASFAWLLSLAGVASTAALVSSEVLDLDDDVVVIISAGSAVAAGIALYLSSRTGLQQLGLAAAAVFLVGSVIGLLPLAEAWTAAVLITCLGVVWLLLTWGGLLTPATVGFVVGSVLMLAVGFGTADGQRPGWSVAGIAVALGLVSLSMLLDSRWVLAVAVLGLVVWIPVTVTLLFEGSVAVPVAILVTGIVTLAAVLLAVRRDRTRSSQDDLSVEETVDA